MLFEVFKRLLFIRLKENVSLEKIIPDHQFGFREKHSTIQQCHTIIHKIMESLGSKKIYAAVFLDIQQDLARRIVIQTEKEFADSLLPHFEIIYF